MTRATTETPAPFGHSQKQSLFGCFCFFLVLCSPARALAERGGVPFEFALIGDPQIGYGHGGSFSDAERFRKVVAAVNAAGVELAILPGDLVQSRRFWEWRAFEGELGQLKPKVLLTAGNHDVVSKSSLDAFRERFGRDYYDFVKHNAAFVMVDSETARDPHISPVEYEKQWKWLEARLRQHALDHRDPIVIATHRPPFAEAENEPSSEGNWPRETRRKLLALARTYGVRWFLSGHLHSTLSARTSDGIHVEVVAGSARIFDDSPIGFRRFKVANGTLESSFVKVASAPPKPFHVPGVPEWTPRLFDFSWRHWLFTMVYIAVGFAALRTRKQLRAAARKASAAAQKTMEINARLWLAIAVGLFFFGANMQLDLDEFAREGGRVLAKVLGVHEYRHWITLSGLCLGVLAVAVGLARGLSRATASRRGLWALAMLSVPTLWFVLSAVSHHDLGMLMEEQWWDLGVLGALGTMAALAVAEGRSRP